MGSSYRIAAIGPDGGTFSDVVPLEYGLVVEDGTGKPDADSYNSLAEIDDYHARHGDPAAWSTLTVSQKEAAARRATSEGLDAKFGGVLQGAPTHSGQRLAWPRLRMVERGRAVASNVVPRGWKSAHAVLALKAATGPLWTDLEPGQNVVSESRSLPGGFSKSTTYDGAKQAQKVYALVEALVAPYLLDSDVVVRA